VNRDQEVSLPSEVTRFLVSIPLRLASTPNVKKDLKSVVKAQGKPAPKLEVHERKVASTDAPKEAPPRAATSNLHLAETENDWRLNDAYSASLLQLAMGSEGMLSSDQQVQNQDPSLTAEFELRGFKWWDRVGAEASVQSQTLGLNGTSRQTQTLSIQAQGHYRWTVPWHWFSFLREVQLSALLGAEAYRSAGTHDYSQGYNLLKTGFTLEFPLGSRWFTGGELLYGEALDASYKYEASGHLNYFIRRQWSCGAGYRVQFFQAGSSASSPSGLPYREAYGQTDLMLRYSF
jgi:hypothetical protein